MTAPASGGGRHRAASVAGVHLAEHTTLRLGGPARRLVEAGTDDELIAAVREADAAGEPLLVLAGGSNVVIADDGFDGTVVLVCTEGIRVEADACSGATVTAKAGEAWDAFVRRAIDETWVGVEALSGIPGSVGATPIQNVGAYGQEVAQTIASVRTFDRVERSYRTFAATDLAFGYRTSRLKREPGRYVVLEVTFQLAFGTLSAPIGYAELARRLGVALGERAPARDVRDAVLALRRSKGMVLDDDDHDTWSAGSFFTNPILNAEQAAALPAAAPRYAQADGTVKTSAAWLIDQAGFSRGFASRGVGVSSKHTLALTNRGSGTTEELLALARQIRLGVAQAFGVRLENEPVLVGCSLDQV